MEKGIFTNRLLLPAEIVLAPAWWFANAGIIFDEDFSNVKGSVELKFQYQSMVFYANLDVISSYYRGIGGVIRNKSVATCNHWDELYNIISDRGLVPHYNVS